MGKRVEPIQIPPCKTVEELRQSVVHLLSRQAQKDADLIVNGPFDMNDQRVANVADPASERDATNRAWVVKEIKKALEGITPQGTSTVVDNLSTFATATGSLLLSPVGADVPGALCTLTSRGVYLLAGAFHFTQDAGTATYVVSTSLSTNTIVTLGTATFTTTDRNGTLGTSTTTNLVPVFSTATITLTLTGTGTSTTTDGQLDGWLVVGTNTLAPHAILDQQGASVVVPVLGTATITNVPTVVKLQAKKLNGVNASTVGPTHTTLTAIRLIFR